MVPHQYPCTRAEMKIKIAKGPEHSIGSFESRNLLYVSRTFHVTLHEAEIRLWSSKMSSATKIKDFELLFLLEWIDFEPLFGFELNTNLVMMIHVTCVNTIKNMKSKCWTKSEQKKCQLNIGLKELVSYIN
jgi:hypothetical protein